MTPPTCPVAPTIPTRMATGYGRNARRPRRLVCSPSLGLRPRPHQGLATSRSWRSMARCVRSSPQSSAARSSGRNVSTAATSPAPGVSTSPTTGASSPRRIPPRHHTSSAPRQPGCVGWPLRMQSPCRRSSLCATSSRTCSCWSGSTRAAAAPRLPRSGSADHSRLCTAQVRPPSGARTGARRAAAACPTSRARPGRSSTPHSACCRLHDSPVASCQVARSTSSRVSPGA